MSTGLVHLVFIIWSRRYVYNSCAATAAAAAATATTTTTGLPGGSSHWEPEILVLVLLVSVSMLLSWTRALAMSALFAVLFSLNIFA